VRPAVKMAGFRRGEGRTWSGKGGEVVLVHLGFRSEGWMGWRSGRQWSSAAARISSRSNSDSSELGASWCNARAREVSWGVGGCNTLPTKAAPPSPSVGANTRTHSTLLTLSSSLRVKGLTQWWYGWWTKAYKLAPPLLN
jgi:hypothetical protein